MANVHGHLRTSTHIHDGYPWISTVEVGGYLGHTQTFMIDSHGYPW